MDEERPRAVQMRPRAAPETLQEPLGQLPRCSLRRSRHQTESEALANGFRLDFRSMFGSSEVRFALVFTGFCRCRTLCAWSVRRIEKLRKKQPSRTPKSRFGASAERNKFERKNGQLARKYTLEVPSGPPKNFKSARTRALRASKSACERPRRARNPKPPKHFAVISRWICR